MFPKIFCQEKRISGKDDAPFSGKKAFFISNLYFSSLAKEVEDYNVEVCTGGENCVKCGVFPNTKETYVWVDSIRPVETVGETIEMTQSDGKSQYMSFCEIKIIGAG